MMRIIRELDNAGLINLRVMLSTEQVKNCSWRYLLFEVISNQPYSAYCSELDTNIFIAWIIDTDSKRPGEKKNWKYTVAKKNKGKS